MAHKIEGMENGRMAGKCDVKTKGAGKTSGPDQVNVYI
jgi:hypothetical protein